MTAVDDIKAPLFYEWMGNKPHLPKTMAHRN